MNGTCFAVVSVAREGSFETGKGTSIDLGVSEDLTEVSWSAEVKTMCIGV